MAQSVSKQFHAALSYLLGEEGRGAQSRLSCEQKIDRGYLNAIVKGRKPGSEEVRMKIAAHFRMTYEEMLAMGRRLLDGDEIQAAGAGGDRTSETTPVPAVSAIAHAADGNATAGDRILPFVKPGREGSIAEKIRKTVFILESNTACREVLANLIDALYETVGTEKDNLTLRNQMKEMESRIAAMEKSLANKKDRPLRSA